MPIPMDDTGSTEHTEISAEEAILATLLPPKAAKGAAPATDDADDEDEDNDEDEDEGADEGDEDDGEDGDEGDDADEDGDGEDGEDGKDGGLLDKAAPKDDAVVKVTVDGVETEVTIGSLKRLAGQEASLTKKSQEADLVGGRAAILIQGAIEAASEDLEQYKGIDWLSLSTQMPADEFQWHRENFTRHQTRLNALMEKAGQFEQLSTERAETHRKAQAEEAVVELQRDIPAWGEPLYGEIMDFAIKQGLPEGDVAKIANAKIIKLLHKAMLYDKGEAVVATKVNMAPSRVKRGSSSESITDAPSAKLRRLEKVMQSGRGTDQDAQALLMGRWGK